MFEPFVKELPEYGGHDLLEPRRRAKGDRSVRVGKLTADDAFCFRQTSRAPQQTCKVFYAW